MKLLKITAKTIVAIDAAFAYTILAITAIVTAILPFIVFVLQIITMFIANGGYSDKKPDFYSNAKGIWLQYSDGFGFIKVCYLLLSIRVKTYWQNPINAIFGSDK